VYFVRCLWIYTVTKKVDTMGFRAASAFIRYYGGQQTQQCYFVLYIVFIFGKPVSIVVLF
jgi:hypothetical protein